MVIFDPLNARVRADSCRMEELYCPGRNDSTPDVEINCPIGELVTNE